MLLQLTMMKRVVVETNSMISRSTSVTVMWIEAEVPMFKTCFLGDLAKEQVECGGIVMTMTILSGPLALTLTMVTEESNVVRIAAATMMMS